MAWRAHTGRDPEAEVQRLNRQFQAVSRRYGFAKRRPPSVFRQHWGIVLAIAAVFIGVAGHWIATAPAHWTVALTVRHIAATPDCSAARAVGLAPAYRGQPGYHPQHDRDRDGIACEPWPRR